MRLKLRTTPAVHLLYCYTAGAITLPALTRSHSQADSLAQHLKYEFVPLSLAGKIMKAIREK